MKETCTPRGPWIQTRIMYETNRDLQSATKLMSPKEKGPGPDLGTGTQLQYKNGGIFLENKRKENDHASFRGRIENTLHGEGL